MTDDYPDWTRYSSGNPWGWRRIYRGLLLYAFDGTGSCGPCWMGPSGTNHPAGSFEDAKRQAEAWADVASVIDPQARTN